MDPQKGLCMLGELCPQDTGAPRHLHPQASSAAPPHHERDGSLSHSPAMPRAHRATQA